MSTRKKPKVPKYVIHKNMNDDIMKLLNEHLDDMSNTYDDRKISKRIFDCLNKSYKERQKIHHEYILTDLKKIKHKTSRFFDNHIRNHIIHNFPYLKFLLFIFSFLKKENFQSQTQVIKLLPHQSFFQLIILI